MADKPLTWPERAAQLYDKLNGVLKIRTLDAQQGLQHTALAMTQADLTVPVVALGHLSLVDPLQRCIDAPARGGSVDFGFANVGSARHAHRALSTHADSNRALRLSGTGIRLGGILRVLLGLR